MARKCPVGEKWRICLRLYAARQRIGLRNAKLWLQNKIRENMADTNRAESLAGLRMVRKISIGASLLLASIVMQGVFALMSVFKEDLRMQAIHGGKLMVRYFWLCGIAVLALVACTTSSVLVPGNSNECMVLPEHGYVADGTQVRILQCHGAANQQWNFANGQITGIGGSCLDVQGGAANDGARVIAVTCSGAPSQQWNISNGRVVGIGGRCLDVLEGNLFDRAPLIISTCTGASSQQWTMH